MLRCEADLSSWRQQQRLQPAGAQGAACGREVITEKVVVAPREIANLRVAIQPRLERGDLPPSALGQP
jgi:hypothetical protein